MLRSLSEFLSSYPVAVVLIGIFLIGALSYDAFLTIRSIRAYNKSCEVNDNV